MEKSLFWKNFNLGTELDIAGAFLYNGLRSLDEMDSLYHESEVFDFLYNLSVGIERVLKVTVILIEHDHYIEQEEFEKSLITHSHLDLIARVKKKHHLNLATQHNSFLQLLGNFYKSMRYDRYGLESAGPYSKEKDALKAYISKYKGVVFPKEDALSLPFIDQKIKNFLGKIVGKVSEELYSIIKKENARLNIYTYELPSESKAEKIFIRQEYNFLKEDYLFKELLISAMNSPEDKGILKILRTIKPLEFDGSLNHYFRCLKSKPKMLEYLDELEHLHEEEVESDEKKERFQILNIIGENNICFDDE